MTRAIDAATSAVLLVWVPMVPPPCLLPNARPDRWTKAKAAKALREAAYLATVDVVNRTGVDRAAFAGSLAVRLLIVWPPNRPGADADNALASVKAAVDGVAQALGADDRWFTFDPVSQAVGHTAGDAGIEIEVAPAETPHEARQEAARAVIESG